jgi:hypothetical protein
MRLAHLYKRLLLLSILFLDYTEATILPHHITSSNVSSLDCLSMIVESIDPTKLVNSSNGIILNRCC